MIAAGTVVKVFRIEPLTQVREEMPGYAEAIRAEKVNGNPGYWVKYSPPGAGAPVEIYAPAGLVEAL